MNRLFFLFFAFLFFAHAESEPSAFERQSGATKKDIRTLKDSSVNLSSIVTDLQNRIIALEQNQDGLRSIYDGQSQRLQKMALDLDTITLSVDAIKGRLELMNNAIRTNTEEGSVNSKNMKELIDSLKVLDQKLQDVAKTTLSANDNILKEIERINKQVVQHTGTIKNNEDNILRLDAVITSNEKRAIAREVALKNAEKIKIKEKETKAVDNFVGNPSKKKETIDEARGMITAGKYTEAKTRLEWLLSQKYRVAEVNFLFGEIAFLEDRYNEAISFYKESATLYDKAQYMPVLLLNTAKSFIKLNDEENATIFLDSIAKIYPKSKEAELASKIKTKLNNKGKK